MTRLGYRHLGLLPVVVTWALPLLLGLYFAFLPLADAQAWRALFAHPQLWGALALSLWTGAASLALSLGLTLLIVTGLYSTRHWPRLAAMLGPLMAIPHLSFAIGFAFLIMPSGILARTIVGGDSPPLWVTVQDPFGIGLIACLALKETPFILAMMWNVLAQSPVAQSYAGQFRSARSLGHGAGSAWLRVLLPQLLPRLFWPLVIVWTYGVTVVDMALVIGPTQPPTLGAVIWSDLNNADTAINARGAAGALLLTLAIAACAGLAVFVFTQLSRRLRVFATRGPSLLSTAPRVSLAVSMSGAAIYVAVTAVLAVMSVTALWPYPDLLPDTTSLSAWHRLAISSSPFFTSLALAVLTPIAALAAIILWFESISAGLDRLVTAAAILALGLPALLVAGGQYRLLLHLDLTATFTGLFLVHLTPVLAYVFIVLKGPYRGFDPHYRAVAFGLNASNLRFWLKVKAPLLRAPLLMSAAIGFAVSFAQFVPAQLVAAGRFTTLPMDAVTLASGGNRPLTAAAALLLAVVPAIVFAGAYRFGRPRWN